MKLIGLGKVIKAIENIKYAVIDICSKKVKNQQIGKADSLFYYIVILY